MTRSAAAIRRTEPAEVALDQFEKRRAYLRQEVAAGRLAASEANQRALPWLAIARAAGADLAEMYTEVVAVFPNPGTPVRVRYAPDDICDRAHWRDTLARARDAAHQAYRLGPTDQLEREAADLAILAIALGIAPPRHPGEGRDPAQKEAA